MTAWIASGRVLDVIVLGMAVEGAVLVAVWRASGRGVAPGALLPNLFSGMCLLMAMRAALAGTWWGWVSLPLLGALLFHVADLRLRWSRNGHVRQRQDNFHPRRVSSSRYTRSKCQS